MKKISIDVTKIKKEWLVDGKYLNMVEIPTPDSKYGNSDMVVQEPPKSVWEPEKDLPKEQKTKGPILGNTKVFGTPQQNTGTPPPQSQPTQMEMPPEGEGDELPF
jgi:hypothetical protein